MRYRTVTLYFLTGTGNSYRVAAWLAEAARDAGAAVTVRPIEAAAPAQEVGVGEGALLVLTMPTHGFTAPWAMIRFALRLPRRKGTHAVAVAARAGLRMGRVFVPGFEGSGPYLLAFILALKGYRVRGALGVNMPCNWIALHPGPHPETAASIVARARVRVAGLADAIFSGERRFCHWLIPLAGLLFVPISLAYMLFGRLYLAKLFFASTRCNGCGLCAEHCPVRAIKMWDGQGHRRPYWTFRCQSCMRCMAYCPTRAIEASPLLIIASYLLPSALSLALLFSWLARSVPALGFLARGVPRWLLESFYPLIALYLIYPLFSLLVRLPPVNWLFTHLTLTHYYRRYHEPDTRLKDLE
jgi:Pyruvate/2-oxoacid:ferredoxin oxidoreductase delta subunit